MAISILIQNSREDEDCRSSKFFSQLGVELSDRDLCSEPHPHLLLPLCERAARQVLRDLPSFGEQERSKPPLGLLYSRQVSSLLGHLLMEWWKLLSTQHPLHFQLKFTLSDPQVSRLKRFTTFLVDFAQFRVRLFARQPGASGEAFHSRRPRTQDRAQQVATLGTSFLEPHFIFRKRERMLLAVCLRLARVCQGGHFGGGDQGGKNHPWRAGNRWGFVTSGQPFS